MALGELFLMVEQVTPVLISLDTVNAGFENTQFTALYLMTTGMIASN
jgi:hypothetical protein